MLPQQTVDLINSFAERSEAILRENFVGVYLHGSAVMGCFNPQKSDLDFIIVVKSPLSSEVKRAYMDMVVECNAMAPLKGIEMSAVLQSVCKPFVYPTPFELHFSLAHLAWYKACPEDYIQNMRGVDRDLAAHFTIIVKRGACLRGLSIEEVFSEVPSGDYMDSIWYDVEGVADEIADNTMYLTLNLARALAYKEAGLVLSKQEGGYWALNHLPEEYRPLIRDALNEYTKDAKVSFDKALAVRYAGYALDKIKQ